MENYLYNDFANKKPTEKKFKKRKKACPTCKEILASLLSLLSLEKALWDPPALVQMQRG